MTEEHQTGSDLERMKELMRVVDQRIQNQAFRMSQDWFPEDDRRSGFTWIELMLFFFFFIAAKSDKLSGDPTEQMIRAFFKKRADTVPDVFKAYAGMALMSGDEHPRAAVPLLEERLATFPGPSVKLGPKSQQSLFNFIAETQVIVRDFDSILLCRSNLKAGLTKCREAGAISESQYATMTDAIHEYVFESDWVINEESMAVRPFESASGKSVRKQIDCEGSYSIETVPA